MSIQHRELAAGRWWELSIAEQLGNVGSEVGRSIRWSSRNPELARAALDRALELIDLALQPSNKDYQVLVAVREGKLVGYVCYGPTPMTDGTCDLYWIASDPQVRGQGVGAALVSAMEGDLRRKKARLIRVELHKRFSIPAACIVFAFLGLALGARARRSGRSFAFVASLCVFVVYQQLFYTGERMAANGRVSPLSSS